MFKPDIKVFEERREIFLDKFLETLLDGIIARSMNCCSKSGKHL